MGQYFITINKTKKEYIDTYTFGDGAKFLEFMSSDMGMKEATMMLLTNAGDKTMIKDFTGQGTDDVLYMGHWASDSIEVLGDYAEEGNLWEEIQDEKTKWKNISVPVYKALFEHNAWFKEKMDERLRNHPQSYLYSDQKKVLTEVFPEAMMEGKLREKIALEKNLEYNNFKSSISDEKMEIVNQQLTGIMDLLKEEQNNFLNNNNI